MASLTKASFSSFMLTISGELHVPTPSSVDRKGAAIVVSHPMTGVKEQTATLYAKELAKAGFYALTFDAGYQGESSGRPRGLEDPHQRVEDIKAGVTYLSTLGGKVDPTRIGVLGICASGGYASYAASSDSRIRAVATISAACVGRMTRGGGLQTEDNKESLEAISGALQASGKWRNDQGNGVKAETPVMFPTDPAHVPENGDGFFREAASYYGTVRGTHPRSDQKVPPASFDLMVNYDSFNFQHLISPRALLMIAGKDAQTLHYSKWAVEKAKEPKELVILPGYNHFSLYDDLTESAPKLVEFYAKYL